MQEIIQMCSFDGTKSTKGASKMRRDMINSEISQLRDLLPLPSSTRQRLSQLQLMALVCVYVRKSNYFQQILKHQDPTLNMTPNIGFSKSLNGFIMMITQGGKLLFISDNAAEYLGHSMEDLLIHGDSVFDIIDKQDHSSVQAELIRGVQGSNPGDEDRLFLCRMNVSRNARRQMRFGDQKVVLVRGHYMSYLPLCSRNEPVFLAHCSPVAMPETRESVVQGATNIFTSVHTLDMKFISIDANGEFYLGYSSAQLAGSSWYQLVHPDSLREAQTKHKLVTSSEQDRACILLLQFQTASGAWRWVHCVLQVKESSEHVPPASTQTSPSSSQSTQTVIIATNQVLGDKEAGVLRANSWLYHYYAMQSKLQYGLSYETQRVHPYYPQVMPYQTDAATHYMSTQLNTAAMVSPTTTPHAASPYTFAAGSPYLQAYHHPYSVRLHHGLDYQRDSSYGYYDCSSPGDSPSSFQSPNSSRTFTGSPPQAKVPKVSASPKNSPRHSPLSTAVPSDSGGGVAVVAPVALRLSPAGYNKGGSVEVEDDTWKQSPVQEVPDYYEHPYITPPYTSTPTKLGYSFEPTECKDTLTKDHRVPSVDRQESSWTSDVISRSPWLPAEEITGPLRMLNQVPH